METIVIETNSSEESETIKAFLKTLNVNFRSSKAVSLDTFAIAATVVEGYQEALSIESGKTKAKSYSSFKEILDEL